MIEKFWEKVGENLAGEWDLRRLGPALAFWAGGLLLWGAWGNLMSLSGLFHLTAVQAGVVIVASLAVITLSQLAVSALSLPTLRLLEGYWTPWPFNSSSYLGRIWPFRYLQARLAEGMRKRWERRFEGEYQKLAGSFGKLDSIQAQRYAHLDAELLTAYPKQPQLFLPTQVGNLLRAAEEYPQYWYGLHTFITWPRLWLLLPEPVQKEISGARQALDQSVTWLLWAVLFSAWVMVSGWAVLISILAAFIVARRIFASAGAYAEVIRSAYDLYRFNLYKNLGWPLPKTPAEEREMGEQITQFLCRRQTPAGFAYQVEREKEMSNE